jgi:hypothetical protein
MLIAVASAPQASVSGFHNPYTIPDVATAALGVLLTVAILATAGRPGQPVRHDDALSFCISAGERADDVLDCGAGDPNRTGDLPFTRRLLCLLSYTGAGLGAW